MLDQLAYSAANHFGELETYYGRGREFGLQQGRQEGRKEGKQEIAYQMLVDGISLEVIEKYTGFSKAELTSLLHSDDESL